MASPPSCGGRPCDGEQQKSLPCNSFSCPAPLCVWAGWEDWSEWSEAVTSWYSEVSMFPASSVSQYQFSPDTGHYSQLVWADTSRVGCGLTEFTSGRF